VTEEQESLIEIRKLSAEILRTIFDKAPIFQNEDMVKHKNIAIVALESTVAVLMLTYEENRYEQVDLFANQVKFFLRILEKKEEIN